MRQSDEIPVIPPGHDNDPEAMGKICDFYRDRLLDDASAGKEADKELQQNEFRWTHEAVRLDPYGYSFRMGRCYAEE